MLLCLFTKTGIFCGSVRITQGALHSAVLNTDTKRTLGWNQVTQEGILALKTRSTEAGLHDLLDQIPPSSKQFASAFIRYAGDRGFNAVHLTSDQVRIFKQIKNTPTLSSELFQLTRALSHWPEQDLSTFQQAIGATV